MVGGGVGMGTQLLLVSGRGLGSEQSHSWWQPPAAPSPSLAVGAGCGWNAEQHRREEGGGLQMVVTQSAQCQPLQLRPGAFAWDSCLGLEISLKKKQAVGVLEVGVR